MFTLEIAGNPIAVTDADKERALSIFGSDAFKQDLAAMTRKGRPLWDGLAPLSIRPASLEEVAIFEGPGPGVDDFSEEEAEDAVFVTFLVPVDHDHDETSAIPPQLLN